MRFRFPLLPAEFEIPDAWWSDAGMTAFGPGAPSYRCTPHPNVIAVLLREIEPPFRNPGVLRDWQGFDRARMIRVLGGMATGAEMPPVPVVALPPADDPAAPFAWRVCDGFHRFYASVAAGFEMLPVVIR
jgi:hypothetical protein